MSFRRGVNFATAAVAALALGLGTLAAASPAQAQVTAVSNATFDWGINNESNGGAYFGGCNFLSAGVAGDTGSATVWTPAMGLYKASEGNTTIVKPTANGSGVTPATWETRCQTPSGQTVNGKASNNPDSFTQSRVQIRNGKGTVDVAARTATIKWEGSFTIAYYGGMTYWSVSDPQLVVNADGTGTVTGRASGYGANMDDASVWTKLAEVPNLTLATLTNVAVTEAGISVTPDYLGVQVPSDVAGRNPQATKTPENSAWWGAFPADFLRFQTLTGQTSYWFTTDGGSGSIQPRKATLPLAVTYSADSGAASFRSPIADQTVFGGDTATFEASVSGENYELSWERAPAPGGPWERINNSNTATLTEATEVPEPATTTQRFYHAVLTPAGGTPVYSTIATLTVTDPRPGFVSLKPADVRTTNGSTATFEVKPTGRQPTVQWERRDDTGTWKKIAGATAPAYQVAVTAADDGARFRAVVSASGTTYPPVTSDEARLFVTTGAPGTPTAPTGPTNVSDAVFAWGLNQESSGGAFFGGCNFLSAGVAGDSGSAKVWKETDGFYRTTEGTTRVVKVGADGQEVAPTWADKCRTIDGQTVSTANLSSTNTVVRMSGGTGTADPSAGTATISWTGSFTVAFYGGMTYWSASNPTLTVTPDGRGVITATASGFATDMDDTTKWGALAPEQITLATLSGVTVTPTGFTVTPDYVGVGINSVGGRENQTERTADNAAFWGSFPQSFVDFQVKTGQSSYWYSSGGARDKAKPTTPVTVCLTSTCSITPAAVSAGGANAIAQPIISGVPRALSAKTATSAPLAAAVAASGALSAHEKLITTKVESVSSSSTVTLVMTLLATIGALVVLMLLFGVIAILVATGTLRVGKPGLPRPPVASG